MAGGTGEGGGMTGGVLLMLGFLITLAGGVALGMPWQVGVWIAVVSISSVLLVWSLS